MNKKLFLGMFAAAGMLLATSCSNDELDMVQSGNEAQVTFSLAAEGGIATRAISDGTGADLLYYAIFDAHGKLITTINGSTAGLLKKENAFPNGSKEDNVEVTLAKGQEYTAVFWAQDASCTAYTVTAETDGLKVAVDYEGDNNDETRDAFFKAETFKVTGNTEIDVVLKRPFAQINVGVTEADWKAAVESGIEITASKVVIKNAATSINLLDGTVKGEQAVEYDFAAIPTDPAILEVDVDRDGTIQENEKYKYLSMSYILTDNDEKRTTLEADGLQFTFKSGGEDIVFDEGLHAVPVQRNWRTNILGKLLTGDIQFNIVIDADFIDSPKNDYIVSVWDGESATTPVADADGVYRISSAEELVGMMNDSKSPNCNNYQNVVLECDIDLGGNTISGFGDESGFFDGIFDGQGHSISNFKIDATNRTYYAGLFNQVSQYSGTNTVIKNLIVKNATVAGTSQVGVIVGGMNGNTIVENCKVYNSTVKAVKKVGSVVGYTAGGTVKDNYAENCVIEYSEKEASEILGYENTGSTVSGNTFNNITFVVSATALATELTPDANGVITLTRDYTVTGDWTSLALSGTVTIEGNNHTIKGINQPLVAGTGGINITVNDLTISESVIGIATVENGLGTAAFISYIDHSGKASFTNCHLFESKVTGNERAAALLAFSEASEVSIKNCSVVKCELTSVGGAAGLVAYTHSTTTVENSKVENTIVEATEDRTSKTALAGAVIGTVTANTTFTNVTVSGNTVKNNGADAHSDMVGRVVSGTLTVN